MLAAISRDAYLFKNHICLVLDKWLAEIGYPQYISQFKAANIDDAYLTSKRITEETLTAVGIKSKIHTKKILASAAERFTRKNSYHYITIISRYKPNRHCRRQQPRQP